MPHALIFADPASAVVGPTWDATRAWREEFRASIEWHYRVSTSGSLPPRRVPVQLVSATGEALARLPAGLRAQEIPTLAPRRCAAAYVCDVAYEHRGRTVRGLLHFAAGDLVYVAQPWSGDGYERTYFVGRDRETGRYVSVMGPTARLKRWHVAEVTHPVALFLTQYWWQQQDDLTYLDELAERAKREAALVWEDGEWRALRARCFEPERPRLVECVVAVLGCRAEDVPAWAADGTLGARLAGAERGRLWRGAGEALVRSARAAWELLAPPAWLDARDARGFARPDLAVRSEPAPRVDFTASRPPRVAIPEHPSPARMSEVVAFCSAPEGVATAEALAAEVAAALPEPRGASRVLWSFETRATLRGALWRRPWFDGGDALAPEVLATRQGVVTALRALARAVFDDDDITARRVADDLRRARGPSHADLVEPALALLALGYAIVDVTDAVVHLVCPAFPRVALRDVRGR